MVPVGIRELRMKNWFSDKILLGNSPGEYVRGLVTPFNIIAAMILAVGLPVTWIRFTQGIGAATNLSNTNHKHSRARSSPNA